MKTKHGFNLRTVCGEHIIVAEGKENIDFSNIISMNESSAFLWQKVTELDEFTVDTLVEMLMSEYEVDEQTARHDSELLAAQWGKAEIIEGDDIPDVEVEVVKNLSASDTEQQTPASQPVAAPPAKKRSFLQRLFGKH